MKIDHGLNKSFLFGNDQSSSALGLAQFTAGLCGAEQTVGAHVVDGGTPMLLSGKWLYEQEAVINFKNWKGFVSQTVQSTDSVGASLHIPFDAAGDPEGRNGLGATSP